MERSKLEDFKEPAHITQYVEEMPAKEREVFRYILSQIQTLRCSRHDFDSRLPSLETQMETLQGKIESSSSQLDKLIKELEMINASRQQFQGAFMLAKFLGFGFISSFVVGGCYLIVSFFKGE